MKKIIYLPVIAILLLTACQPEVSNVIEKDKVQTSLEDFYKNNRSAVQSFVVGTDQRRTITTTKGIKISLPANGFVTSEGSPVTGSVEVNIKEILSPLEMIFNDMPTMSGGLPLESGGEFQVRVTKNGQRLKLAAGNWLQIQLPKDNSNTGVMNGMQVFKGVVDAQDKVIDWQLSTAPGNLVVGDSTLFAGWSIFSDNTEWINCDKFYNLPTVEFTVQPGNAPSTDSTNVFVHLTGRNSVVKMDWTQGLSYFKSDKLLAVPSSIIGISVKNGKLYASVTPVVVQNGQSVTMNFSPYTESELKKKLGQLK